MSITDRAKLGIGFAFQQPVKFKGLSVKDLIELSSVIIYLMLVYVPKTI